MWVRVLEPHAQDSQEGTSEEPPQELEEEDPLRFHFLVHSALDVFEERDRSNAAAADTLCDTYCGLLFPVEDFVVYGYTTKTKLKLVAVLEDAAYLDAAMQEFFERLHVLVMNALGNPFHRPGNYLRSAKLDASLDALIRELQGRVYLKK